jgi:hypothetical protein
MVNCPSLGGVWVLSPAVKKRLGVFVRENSVYTGDEDN